MAKGKGKGHGDDDSGNCCCCLCLCILLPPILVAVGVFLFAANNTRVERITSMKRRCGISVRYNTRAEQWVNEGITTFANKSFTISGIPLELSLL